MMYLCLQRLLLTLALTGILIACSAESTRGAAEGAGTGAAIGGMVTALVFGGDVGNAAARGAVWGGTTGVHFTWRTITTHEIDPNVDETREFLVEDLAYAQFVKRFGYVGGVGPAAYDKPRGNLTGDPYFTDGKRIVIWISKKPNGIDEIEVLDLSSY